MRKLTTVRNASSKRGTFKGVLLIVGLVAWAAVEGAAGKLVADEREQVVADVESAVECGIKAKYGRPPENPSDAEIARITQDVEQLAERELESRYGYLAEDERESIKKSISLDFRRGMQSRRTAATIETRIEQLQGLPSGELEKQAQAGDPYAQYALGRRIRNKIGRWESGTNSRKLDDYRLLDYAGQLLLAAAETAIEKKMHCHFTEGVAHQLTSWHLTCQSYRAPILKDPEFRRRWEIVRHKLECSIPDLSEES